MRDMNISPALAQKMARDGTYQVGLLARLAHEINREYCLAIGDDSQLPWQSAPLWQQESAIAGVVQHLQNPDMTPELSHMAWYKHKLDEGWKYGQEKDPEKKEHPCMVPYAQLPAEQRAKDYLFRAAVKNGYLLMQHALDSAKERESQLQAQLEHAAEQRRLKDRKIRKLEEELAERKATEQADGDTLAWLRVNGADLESLLKWWRGCPWVKPLEPGPITEDRWVPEGVEGARPEADALNPNLLNVPSEDLVSGIYSRMDDLAENALGNHPPLLDDIKERVNILAVRLAAHEAQSKVQTEKPGPDEETCGL